MARTPVPGAAVPPPTSGLGYGFVRAGGIVHLGVDLVGVAGGVVVAPEAGTVTDVLGRADPQAAANTTLQGQTPSAARDFPGIANPWDGYGPGIVVVAGDSGVFHLMAHLAAQTVAVGDHVDEGEAVGVLATRVGAAAPHCHWEVRLQRAVNTPQERARLTTNPADWLAGAPPRGAASTRSSGLWLLALLLLAVKRRRR